MFPAHQNIQAIRLVHRNLEYIHIQPCPLAQMADWIMPSKQELAVCCRSCRTQLRFIRSCSKTVRLGWSIENDVAYNSVPQAWIIQCQLPLHSNGKRTTLAPNKLMNLCHGYIFGRYERGMWINKPSTRHKQVGTIASLSHLDYSSAYEFLNLLQNSRVLQVLLSGPGVLLEIN